MSPIITSFFDILILKTFSGVIHEINMTVSISKPSRGQRQRLIDFVMRNAEDALKRNIAERSTEKKHLEAVAELFDLDAPPTRVEVYDNSHISGTNMVGAMVVAGEEGFVKNAYRKFNI